MGKFRITESAASKLPDEIVKVLRENDCIGDVKEPKPSKKQELFNQLNELLENKIPARYLLDKKEQYIIKKESAITRLFEIYGEEFPGETLQMWQDRWMLNGNYHPPIKVDRFRHGNNRHLLLTILSIASEYMKVRDIELYVKWKFGLSSFHSAVSRHNIKNEYDKHPEADIIREILMPD